MSPERRKLSRLEDSRESWKRKATERSLEVRSLKMRLNELEQSRGNWKIKCAEAQLQIEELQKENTRIFQESKPSFKFFFAFFCSLCAFIVLFPFVLVRAALRFCAGVSLALVIYFVGRRIKLPSRVGRSRSVFSSSGPLGIRTLAGRLSLICPSPSGRSESSAFSELPKQQWLKVVR